MRFTEWFRRYRASRGYGIHSPGAFKVTTRVVRSDGNTVYYGEEELSLADAPARQIKRARMLLRFAAEMQPSNVWVSPGIPEIYKSALRLAGCVVRIFEGDVYPDEIKNADMIVLDGCKLKKSSVQKALTPGKSFIGFDLPSSTIKYVHSLLKGGWLLDGAGSLLASSTSDPALHKYEISRF